MTFNTTIQNPEATYRTINIRFNDIFKLDDIQRLQDLFSDATGVASQISQPDGTPITRPGNFCRLCDDVIRKTEKGRANCCKSDMMNSSRCTADPVIQPCLSSGLWDAGARISVGGQHIATWFIGQVRNEEVDEKQMLLYADEIGADRDEYLTALREVPAMSVKQFNNVAKLLFAFAKELSENAENTLQLKTQIAEREKAVLLLQQSEENFSTTLHSIGDAVLSTDKDGFIVNINSRAAALCGWSKDDAAGKLLNEVFNIVNSDTREVVADPVKKVLESGQIIGLANHTILISKKGDEYQIANSAAPIKDKEGKISGVVLVFSDVTEKYKTERALRESERSKSVLLANIPGMAYRCRFDSEWTMEFVSEGFYTLTGYKAEDVLLNRTVSFKDLILPEYREHLWNVWGRAVKCKGAIHEEYRILTADNQEKWVWEQGIPIYNEAGEVEALEGLILDITERKLAEESLHNERVLLRTIIDNIPDAIYTKDIACRKTLANLTEVRYMGVNSEADVLGKQDFDFYPGKMAEKYLADDQLVLQTGIPVINREDYIQDKNNQKRWLLSSKLPLRDKDNRIIGLVGIGHDITERMQAEKALKESESLYRNLVEELPDGIYKSTQDGEFIDVNPAMVKMLGYESKEELMSIDIKTQLYFDPTDRVGLALIGGTEDMGVFRLKKKNGQEIWVEDKVRYNLDERGNILYHEGVIRDITERKRAESALKGSEALYRNLVEKLPDGVYKSTHDGKFVDVNPAMAKMLGYDSKEELMSIDIKTELYFEPTERENIELPENNIKTGVYRMKKKDGSEIWVEDHGWYNFDESVNILFHEGIMRDVTEYRQAEIALRESEALYRNLVERLPDGVYKSTHEGKFVDVNPAMATMLGYNSKEELMNIDIKTQLYFEPTDRESLVLQENHEEMGVYPLKKKDGSAIWVEDHGWYNVGEDGNILFHEGIMRDVTDRKQADEALRKSEEQHRTILQTALDGFWLVDKNGRLLEVNESYCRMSGYSAGELLLMHIVDLEANEVPDETLARQRKIVEKGESRFETKHRRRDGSIFDIEASVKYQPAEEGRFVVFMHDITDRKIKEKELLKAKEKAEESDRLKSAFLANMSHEIRTPMNGILGFADLLKTPGLTGEEQQEYIRIIRKSGDRMLNIINDIVDISKIESGQMNVAVSETNINKQTEFIYNFFQPEVISKGIHLILRNGLPENEAIISTDKEKVYAVLTNLVKNAIKFTSNGTIEFGYEKKDKFLRFYVKDTGYGIPDSRQKAIFDRFVQADIADSRAFQGAGLGLSISMAYVEMLGGEIWVESTEGVGSAFYFTIPYTSESRQNFITQNGMENSENHQSPKLKILIVEDDETSEMLVSIAVRKFSRQVLKVRNGADAVETCRNNPDIDLILMDVKMPEMDGYEATRQIRQFNKNVYIIAQTAFGLAEEKEKAMEAGCNEYLSKPLDINLLKEMIGMHFKM